MTQCIKWNKYIQWENQNYHIGCQQILTSLFFLTIMKSMNQRNHVQESQGSLNKP